MVSKPIFIFLLLMPMATSEFVAPEIRYLDYSHPTLCGYINFGVTINIYNDSRCDSEAVLKHELKHFIYFNLFSNSLKNHYCQLNGFNTSINWAGNTRSCWELFANGGK